MRTTLANQILKRLIDAAVPVLTDTLAEMVFHPGNRLVIPDLEAGAPEAFGYDSAAGAAYRVPGREHASLTEIDVTIGTTLRKEGWVFRHDRPDRVSPGMTWQLVGRSPLPQPPEPVGRPPADLAGDRVERVRQCLLAAGTYGVPHSVVDEWAGERLMDRDYRDVLDALRNRGYLIDTWASGSIYYCRIVGTPDVAMSPPPPPGTDARMLPDGFGRVPDIVGATEIAQRARVGRPAVETWPRRHETFPVAQWTVRGGPAWDWHEVRAWLQQTGRLPEYQLLFGSRPAALLSDKPLYTWAVQELFTFTIRDLPDAAQYEADPDTGEVRLVRFTRADEPSHPDDTCGHTPCDHYREDIRVEEHVATTTDEGGQWRAVLADAMRRYGPGPWYASVGFGRVPVTLETAHTASARALRTDQEWQEYGGEPPRSRDRPALMH